MCWSVLSPTKIMEMNQEWWFIKTNYLYQKEEATLRVDGTMYTYSLTIKAIVIFSGATFALFRKKYWHICLITIPFTKQSKSRAAENHDNIGNIRVRVHNTICPLLEGGLLLMVDVICLHEPVELFHLNHCWFISLIFVY